MDLAGIINPVHQSLHSQEEDIRVQYVVIREVRVSLDA